MTDKIRLAKPKEGAIEAFRWICILSVLVHHSVFPARQSQGTIDAIFVWKEILSWCVTGFIFASGWFSNPTDSVAKSLLTRSKRLLLPFLGVNALIIVAMLALIHSGLYLPKDHDLWNLRYIGIRMIYLQGVGPQFYFLPYLFITGSLSLWTAKFAGRTGAFAIWLAAFAATCLFHGIPATPFGSELDRMPLYCCVFTMGMALRDGFRHRAAVALTISGLATGIVIAAVLGKTSILHTFVPVPLFFAIRTAFRSRPLDFLSRWNSGAVYLWHAPFLLSAFSIAFFKMGIRDGVGLIATIAATVVACQAIHRLVVKAKLTAYLTL